MFWKKRKIWYSKDKPHTNVERDTKMPRKQVPENQQSHISALNNKKQSYSHIFRVKLFLPNCFLPEFQQFTLSESTTRSFKVLILLT